MLFNIKTKLKILCSYDYERFFYGDRKIVILSAFSVTILILLGRFFPSLFNFIEGSSHPTSIPWIDHESKCQRTGRIWDENKCWDNQHNPMF